MTTRTHTSVRITVRFVGALVFAVTLWPVPVHAQTIDGAELNWASVGEGDPAVIFVHGWTCDSTSWSGQVPAVQKSHRVITLDLPGHGKSEDPTDDEVSLGQFVRAVEAVRKEAKVERAVFVGHSMGTPVVRRYALKHPERVVALVLVDGLVLTPEIAGYKPADLSGEDGRGRREALIRSMFGPSTPIDVQARILKMMMTPSGTIAHRAMQATFDASGFTWDPVDAPVLALYEDGSQADRESMKRLYPRVEYHEVPDTGHFLMMEKPEAFNRLLLEFLGKLGDATNED